MMKAGTVSETSRASGIDPTVDSVQFNVVITNKNTRPICKH